MRRLTADLVDVYQKCKPDFAYHRATNPRRCLTKPAEPTESGGSDNADADLIVFVGDVLVSTSSGRRCVFILVVLIFPLVLLSVCARAPEGEAAA
jgi:dual specificity protein kinase YAK1